MRITSPAFSDGSPIPGEFAAGGTGQPPPLVFRDVPPGTAELVLIVDDPDVPRDLRPDGNFDHWLVWNIPPETGGISSELPPGTVGLNTRGRHDWVPLGPPPGRGPHRYFFRLFAVDQPTRLRPASDKAQLLAAIEGHVVAQAVLMGTYER